MKKRNVLCFAAAVMMAVSSVAMTSCGDSGDETADSGSATAVQGEATAKGAAETADTLKSEIKFVDELNEISAEMVEKFYGISSDKYTDGKVYVGSGGATAEEIACFEAVDESAAAEIKSACEARIESQIKQFEDYVPAELDKLNDPVLVTNGNFVYMCISDDNAKAKEIIG
jgi:hypothetical protein